MSIELIMYTRRSTRPDGERLIYAEEMITRIFCDLVPGVKLEECACEDDLLDDSDQLFG